MSYVRVAARQGTVVDRADEAEARPHLWREYLWPLDWLALRLSPVYYGVGVRRGDGSAVVLVPGFMGTDLYLGELYLWLRRIGYRPYMSEIGLNADCLNHLTQRLVRTVERAHAESERPVRLVGHSLGGIIARGACFQRPELASQLIYLGSPVRAFHPHPAIRAAVSLVRLAIKLRETGGDGGCLTNHCGCDLVQSLARPLPASIRHAAIYTIRDGVVDWHDSLESDPQLNYEVGGTHLGLVCNPRAYRVLADLLAGERPEQPQAA